ncbi:hypothetical protein [Rubrivirga sp.]|uniref:hypothetical protein n=1 Tax=Rubrivirga sp. TaxID=1885344 RepID=UPI003C77C054
MPDSPILPPGRPRESAGRRSQRRRLSASSRRILKWHAIVAALVLILVFLPATGALIAAGIASANGCTLHEGFSNPCVVAGVDIGDSLYPWAVAPWLLFITVPIGAVLLPVIAISAAVMISRARKRESADGRTR